MLLKILFKKERENLYKAEHPHIKMTEVTLPNDILFSSEVHNLSCAYSANSTISDRISEVHLQEVFPPFN